MTLTFRPPLGDEESRSTPHRIEKWCFNDASWKNRYIFSKQGWYNIFKSYDGLMETKNIIASFFTTKRGNESLNLDNEILNAEIL
ncbi:hypothetical protein Bca4012_071467 [Brassica carinata]